MERVDRCGYAGSRSLRFSPEPACRRCVTIGSGSPAADFFQTPGVRCPVGTAIGIGSPRPYPSDYLLAVANLVLVAALGTYGAFIANAFASEPFAPAVRSRSRGALPSSRAAWIAAAAFALSIRGCTTRSSPVMSAWCSRTARRCCCSRSFRRSGRRRSSPASILAAHHAAASVFSFRCWASSRSGRSYVARARIRSASRCFASMPIWIGLLFDRTYLLSIPYTQSWQADASLDPLRALELSGYFVKYADALPPAAGAACWAIARLWRRRSDRRMHPAPVRAAWLVALADRIVAVRIRHERRVRRRVFMDRRARSRERSLSRTVRSRGISRRRLSCRGGGRRAALRGAAVGMASVRRRVGERVGFAPPARFWVPARDFRRFAVDAPANTRYALMPPMQPLSFSDRGDGLDPNAVVLAGQRRPAQHRAIQFPGDAGAGALRVHGRRRLVACA